ncbi:MAG: ribosome-associated translation inhibitor RaiA [Planctomycetota bacterium]|nr:ribosome-associated translation inhibitor RaiA [Planctomycetota bacterium]
MQVAITCRHGSIRPELREYITRKAEKLIKYLDTVSEIDVTIEFEGPRVAVEMLVEIDGYHTIVAHVEGEDTGAAFDKTLHKMEQQVHKHKEKHRDHRHKTSIAEASQEVERAIQANEAEEAPRAD